MRKFLHWLFVVVQLGVAVTAAYQLGLSAQWSWLLIVLMASLPLSQLIFHWDRQLSANGKLRLPVISLLVLLCLALLLLVLPGPGLAISLAIIALGCFLLDTYWAQG